MIAASLLLASTFARAGAAQERIVAIGDVHGSFLHFVGILQQIGLIDADRRWVGGSATLVQTGDVPDRGPRTRECLDLLMALEQQAPQANGKVIPLLGNHEVMDMLGDLRYVSREDYASFADERSEARREEAYREYRTYVDAHPRRRKTYGADDPAARQKWMEEHPVGFFEYRDAFGPQGFYGRWLRTHDAVAQVEDVIFLHGGLSPKFRFRDFREVNERIRSEIQRFDELWDLLIAKKVVWQYMTFREATAEIHAELDDRAASFSDRNSGPAAKEMLEFDRIRDWAIVSPDGPLWYRGLGLDPGKETKRFVERTLARFHAKHIVVGHTSIDSRQIRLLRDNHVFLIDTNMIIDGRGGRTSALEIRDKTFTAHYSGGEQQVLWAPGPLKAIPAGSSGGSQ
jgi:hypothetical protein